ncbi:MAG: radical SAM protein [Clostridiales bacterium]|nr:radical SAM protein [Clostridiales bacterium]
MKTPKEFLTEKVLLQVFKYLETNPEENMPKLLELVDKLDFGGDIAPQRAMIRRVLSDPENVWYKFIRDLWTKLDPEVWKTFFQNFVINATAVGFSQQNRNKEKYDCNIPWAILLDPTSACNLRCTGCWAAEYGHTQSMSFETLDSIITQGKALGTYVYLYTGGEPLVRKDDIIKLCEKHPDCQFLAFTNATLIDEKFADEMLRVKNFMPAMSIEGWEAENDARRGAGVYQKVLRAMDILKERKLPFGVSICYTSKNAEVVGSEEFIDFLIEKGALFAWLFTYMPVGVDAAPELLATAEQREFMYHQVRDFRTRKPIFFMDFFNDGEYVNGCIAGGRSYLHINSAGDIEPCAFIHYSDSNVYDHTLLEAYQRPMFMAYRRNQPFNDNKLRVCPLLDNPGRLAAMVDEAGAHSTDILNPEDVHDLAAKTVEVAEKWAPVADRLWKENREARARGEFHK